MVKTLPYSKAFVDKLFGKGTLIGTQYANEGDPKHGIAYYRYAAFKYKGKLYIWEQISNGVDLDRILKEVDY